MIRGLYNPPPSTRPRELNSEHLRAMLDAIAHVRAVNAVHRRKYDFWAAVADRLGLTIATVRERVARWDLLDLAENRPACRDARKPPLRSPDVGPDAPCREPTCLRRGKVPPWRRSDR